jgi:hypothetical protein
MLLARAGAAIVQAERSAVRSLSAGPCDRFDRCGALPRYLDRAARRVNAFTGKWFAIRASASEAVSEFTAPPLFAMHDVVRPGPQIDGRMRLMRKRLVAWTMLTCTLLAVAVWTVLGPPQHASPQLPSRSLTAAVR